MACHPDRVRRNYEDGDLIQIGSAAPPHKTPLVFHPLAFRFVWPAIGVSDAETKSQRTGEEQRAGDETL